MEYFGGLLMKECPKCRRKLHHGKECTCDQIREPDPDPQPLWKAMLIDPWIEIRKLCGRITQGIGF